MKTDIIKKYKLPKYVQGKSYAEAAKAIEETFKDRSDAYAEESKKTLMQRLAQAQEENKPQEQAPNAYAEGGGMNEWMDENGAKALGAAEAGLGMVQTAFGDTGVDTSGNTQMHVDDVKQGAGVAGGAIDGAKAGMAFGPWGAAIGGVLGGAASFIGGNRKKKDALKGQRNSELMDGKNERSDFALGGTMGSSGCGGAGQPPCPDTNNRAELENPDFQSIRKSTGQNFTNEAMSNLFYKDKPAAVDPSVPNLGKYKGYYDVTNKDGQFSLSNTSKNPRNLDDNKALFSKIQGMNPNMKSNMNLNFKSKFAYGGAMKTNNYFNGGPTDPADENPDKGKVPTKYNLGTPADYDPGKPLRPVATSMSDEANKYKTGAKGLAKVNTPAINKNAPAGKKGKSEGKEFDWTNALRYAPIGANALQLAKLKKPKHESLDKLDKRYKKQTVDESALSNKIETEFGNIQDAVSNASGGKAGAARANLLGAYLNKGKAKTAAFQKANEMNQAENAKAQQFNQGVDRTNLSQSNAEKDINAKNMGAYETAKSKLIAQLGNDIGNIGTEEMRKKYPERMGFMYDSKGKYIGRVDKDGKFVKNTKK